MANQPARQISKAKLQQLVKLVDQTNSRMAEERGALGAKFEAAATSDNFNAKALRPLLPLLRLEPGPQAHLWRTMMLYADHLGIGTQGDLEDVINADAAREGGNGDGTEGDGGDADEDEARALAEEETGDADPVDSLLAGMDTPDLGRFRRAIEEAMTAEAVNKGLERFTSDHPSQADEALEIAQVRLAAIQTDQSGGEEDVRPTALRDAASNEAKQVAEAAKAAPPKRRGKPASPAADAAKDNGIGNDFGRASSVH